MFKKSLILFVLIGFSDLSQSAVSVGSSPGLGVCNYSTIQAALDSGDSSIRVLNTQNFVENILIDHSVDIIGGFSSCNAANANLPVSSNKTIIKSVTNSGESVVRIESNSSPTIRLFNLVIRDGFENGNAVDGGHGINITGSNGLVEINNSFIAFNDSMTGGGIKMTSSTTLTVTLRNSTVISNNALGGGGGIYCLGANVTLNVLEDSLIRSNEASLGGGIAAYTGCTVFLSSGVDVNNSTEKRGVMLNTARSNGGGIYARYSAKIKLNARLYDGVNYAVNPYPVTVAQNTAASDGGGIYAIDDSTVEIIDGLIEGNTAGNDGGGVYVADGADLLFFPSTVPCWSDDSCSVVSNNKSDGLGGGFYVGNGSFYMSSKTIFTLNRADYGVVFFVGELGGAISFNDYMYNNGDNSAGGVYADVYVVYADNGGNALLAHDTIADNHINGLTAILGNWDSILRVYSSIIHNTANVLQEIGSASTTASCLLVNETTTLSGANIYLHDPGFVDSNNQDYHISANSFAIDKCLLEYSTGADTDGDERGYDDPTVVDNEGPYDIGADETYVNDVIFENNFE